MERTTRALLMSGAPTLWLAAAIATLFASPQYARYYVDLQQDQRASGVVGLVLVLAVIVMMAAAGVGILVAVFGSAVITRVFAVLAGVVAIVVMVVGAPGGVVWHARLMTGTAVLTLLLLASAVAFERAPAHRVAPAPASPAPASPASASPASASAGADADAVAEPAGSSPPREPFWRSAARRDVPRWAMALAALVAFAFAITAGLLGVRQENRAADPSAGPTASPVPAEPPHDVIYMVTAPSGVTWLEVVYVDALGRDQRTSPPTGGPAPWVQPIRTGPDTDQIYLAASVASPTRNLKIQCAIFIDGKRAVASEGPSCNVHVRFPR
jgi:hypothetical protein